MNILASITVWLSLGPKRLWLSFITIFGIVAMIIQTVALFVPDSIPKGWSFFIWLIVGSILIATIWRFPKLTISSRLAAPNTEIEIKVGDLFYESGHLVIGTNDCFDTEIGDVISQHSVQGQFLQQMYNGDQRKLDEDIYKALEPLDNRKNVDFKKLRGKQCRYPIGTVIKLDSGGRLYFMLAYTQMNNNLVCESSADWIMVALEQLWEYVRENGQDGQVAVPIIGPELARTGLSRMELLRIIILSFILATKRRKVITKN